MTRDRKRSDRYPDCYVGRDFRKHPELYRVGRGEQGVLLAEPYKSEILPSWRFKNEKIAKQSAAAIYRLFRGYRAEGDFVGMDMARKFLQMGYTRARRYANHRSGRKYSAAGKILKLRRDPEKARAAKVFHSTWRRAWNDRRYQQLLAIHKARHGGSPTTRRR